MTPFLKRIAAVVRSSSMQIRDMVMILAVLILSIALAWAGTDYVVDHVVAPLMQDEPAGAPPT